MICLLSSILLGLLLDRLLCMFLVEVVFSGLCLHLVLCVMSAVLTLLIKVYLPNAVLLFLFRRDSSFLVLQSDDRHLNSLIDCVL